MSVRDSVLMTVYNRPWRVLKNTLHMLRRNDLTNTEIIIVDDGSTDDLSGVKSYCSQYEMPVEWIRVNTVVDRPGTYHINCACTKPRSQGEGCQGYNNPAYAWNCALEAASGNRIIMLASDCQIPPTALAHARRAPKNRVWMSCVVDMDSAMEFLGRQRIAPYGWFMAWKRDVVGEIRQDEEYLNGIDFDDNDFTARLALATGQIEIDLGCTAFHQSHPAVAYTDGGRGHDINAAYTRQKWGGYPWHGEANDPLEWTMGRDDTKLILTVKRRGG